MRFVFAAIVMVNHYFIRPHPLPHYELAVEFFFVLSGFVLCAAYSEKIGEPFGWRKFAVDRIARLYPLHFATLFLMLAIVAIASWRGQPTDGTEHSLSTFSLNIGLLHGIGFLKQFSWDLPSWSISVELYVSFLLGI